MTMNISVISYFEFFNILLLLILCLEIDSENLPQILKLVSYFNSWGFWIFILMIEKNMKIHKSKKLSVDKLWKHPWKILVH